MNRAVEIAKRHSDIVNEVAEMLYGDGAWEVSKALTQQQKRERTQARVGLASNVVGIAAGTAGLTSALKDERLNGEGSNKVSRGLYRAGKAIENTANKTKVGRGYYRRVAQPKTAAALATGAVGLQVANLAGDAVANRVLARSAKKDQIHKAADSDPLTLPNARGKLVKATVKEGFQVAGKLPQGMDNAKITAQKIDLTTKKLPAMSPRKEGPEVKEVKKSFDIEWHGEISKMDTDKRQVFGWASIVEMDGKPVVDLQGDLMTLETIEKAAYDYVRTSRKGGNQHQRDGDGPRHVSDMIESFLVTDEKKKQMGLPDSTPTGWWVGFQINDDETWEQVKKGERKEFSIHGSGVRKELMMED